MTTQAVAGRSPSSSLRFAYVGPSMGLAKAAYAPWHEQRGHSCEYYRSAVQIPANPAPDVVVHAPLDRTVDGLVGACAIAMMVPKTTLLVAIFSTVGYSHAMFVKHALGGDCHPRMLLHYPNPKLRGEDVVERMARAASSYDAVTTTAPLPTALCLDGVVSDLGQIMAENRRMAELLYLGATDRDWSQWKDLATRLHLADGTIKNLNAKLRDRLIEAGIVNRTRPMAAIGPGDNGMDADGGPPSKNTWTAGQLVRFCTEHRSFILAYGQSHLEGLSRPPAGLI
ncbi:MAG: hypothetical protein ACR2QK_10690 [Acidimicrobiales bacterium]